MNPKHIHTPLSTRARCPVCREPVYSLAGVHPQCAVHQSDPPKAKRGQPPIAVDESTAEAVEPAVAVKLPVPESRAAKAVSGRRSS